MPMWPRMNADSRADSRTIIWSLPQKINQWANRGPATMRIWLPISTRRASSVAADDRQ
jgi:hypothetical protein